MSLPGTRQERDYESFGLTSDGLTARRVIVSGGLLPGFSYDEVNVDYPSSAVEVYTFKLASATQSIVTVTYTDSTKDSLLSVVRS